MLLFLEDWIFRRRRLLLALFAALTAAAAWPATNMRLESSFESLLPSDHPYIETFESYRGLFFGADRVTVVLQQEEGEGDIWNRDFLHALYDLTQASFYLPGVDRTTVASLWTPNTRHYAVTAEGVEARDVISGSVTPDAMTEADLAEIRDRAIGAGLQGDLVGDDFRSAAVIFEFLPFDVATGERLDYAQPAQALDDRLRIPFSQDGRRVRIIGFAPLVGEIASAARHVFWFFAASALLAFAAVYASARSLRLTLLPMACSGAALIWLFGLMGLSGAALDPLLLLMPFAVFAIGVSHGVQQIHFHHRRAAAGDDSEQAARRGFRGLLRPGLLALGTDFIGFAALWLMPIPLIRDFALIAATAMLLTIVSGLFLLPLLLAEPWTSGALRKGAAKNPKSSRAPKPSWVIERLCGLTARRRAAPWCAIFFLAASAGTVEGVRRPLGGADVGVSQLSADSRYNRDFRMIADHYSAGLHYLVLVVEAYPDSCIDPRIMASLDALGRRLEELEGVVLAHSAASVMRAAHRIWNGPDAPDVFPQGEADLKLALTAVPERPVWLDGDCKTMALRIALDSLEASRLQNVLAAVESFVPPEGMRVRPALGDAGLTAAANQTIDIWEERLLAIVYALVAAAIFLVYRRLRAVIVCGVPILLTTAFGYGFLSGFGLGLNVTTLPALILMIGLGVDYAFYLYDRIRSHELSGTPVALACRRGLREAGDAVINAATALALGVAVWFFSPLRLQSDMGLLLAFMLFANMVTAVALIPALNLLTAPRAGDDGRSVEDGRPAQIE